jgi:hypothetical protein
LGVLGPSCTAQKETIARASKPIFLGFVIVKSGIWNLGFGLVAVFAGASGQFVLPGTTGPAPLIALGALLATFGLYQAWRAWRASRGR